jgi:Cd2+/Zn2+-exporting ATPase
MRAWLEHEEPLDASDENARRRRVLVGLSATALAAGLATQWLHGPQGLEIALFVASLAASVPLTIRRAWHAVRLKTLDINVLMLIAAGGALLLGAWSEGAAVVFLFALAQALEARTLERARMAVRSLLDLTPLEALVKDESGERSVAVDLVTLGTVIVIKPGEKVPLDGEVIAGTSEVNQAPVTGESLPVEKAAGDEVFAGTINGRGALDVRVTRVRRDTTLARIIHLVERAQSERAPAQTFVERFARVYTPTVIALAILIGVGGPVAVGGGWHEWVYRALVLLVVSCPCALVISTPVSVVAALAGAARKGVLIKGGVYLERVGHVRCVAFDKTGTLTHGTPQVLDVVALEGFSAREIVALAASVEQRSTHPIAHAILRYAADTDVTVPAGVGVASLTGLGAEGRVGAAQVVLGNHRLFEERRLCSPVVHAKLGETAGDGRTPVLVARDGAAVGIIIVVDRPRETGRDTVELLRQQGVESIVLLTGDSRATARAVAEAVGADEFRADLLPEDKVAFVAELRRRFGTVAMVGDGINDAPALASSDVGIAMAAAGSDLALETADVALMADELLKIPYALRLGRATLANIKMNLAISIVMKGAFVLAAVAGVATLWMAVLADTGASVIVIANALRLLRAD